MGILLSVELENSREKIAKKSIHQHKYDRSNLAFALAYVFFASDEIFVF